MRLSAYLLGRRPDAPRRVALALAVISFAWLPVVAADKTAADYFVQSLPGQPDGPLLKMHAGHITVDPDHHGNLFFWLYQNRHIANKQRTVIWLNGGPGCSSMDGALMEVGPYRVGKGGKLEYNDGSWDEFANLLFVDNPVGTGFSYVDTNSYLHELQEMADQFAIFLEKWFAIFPEYSHDDIYIAGESYAGQHIPYIARKILDRNKGKSSNEQWKLKGLLIGNGWIDPPSQYLSYLPYAYKEGIIQGGSDIAKKVETQQAVCTTALSGEARGKVDSGVCEKIMTDILEYTKVNSNDPRGRCINMYDIRLRDDDSCGMNWPPDLDNVTPYLRRSDVTAALHIDPDKRTGWTECNGAVSSNFRALNSKPSIELLPGLLEQVPIVLFSGDRDLICNHLGTESLISEMTFNGGRGFELSAGVTAPRRDWTFEGEPAGFWQEARNLTYVLFYNSSHMVPFDYPRRTRDMLDRFMAVDIASVGGKPVDSQIDGEKGPVTSVGGHPNSTAAEEAQKEKLKQAEWRAYQKSGEVVLVLLVIAVSIWGFFIWRGRRKTAGYKGLGLFGDSGSREALRGAMGMENFRDRRDDRDLEAADFDEHELGESVSAIRKDGYNDSGNGQANEENKKLFDQGDKFSEEMDRDRYSIGGSSDEFDGDRVHSNGRH